MASRKKLQQVVLRTCQEAEYQEESHADAAAEQTGGERGYWGVDWLTQLWMEHQQEAEKSS